MNFIVAGDINYSDTQIMNRKYCINYKFWTTDNDNVCTGYDMTNLLIEFNAWTDQPWIHRHLHAPYFIQVNNIWYFTHYCTANSRYQLLRLQKLR